MSAKIQQQLSELGLKLEKPPATKDSLIKLLKQAATCLSEVDQSPHPSLLDSMQCLFDAIAQPELLKHQDRDVRLLVATCVCEITRITAPEPPYSDHILKDVFHLIVGTLGGLSDTSGPSFARRVVILETLARYRSCIVMLDLECYDLINEMFSIFFAVASDDHSENIISSMQTIMVVLLEESEDIKEDLLLVILSNLGRGKDDTTPAARKLAMNVIAQCAGQLEPVIQQFLISSMSGEGKSLDNPVNYHEVLYDIYRCAPKILLAVIPYLTGELLTDELGTRLEAVKLVGDLFSLPDCSISEALQPIFSEFIKRLTDRVVEVRMSVLEQIKRCMMSNPFRGEAPQINGALCDRLLDYDENVRKQVVAVVCDVACQSPDSIPVDTMKLVAERLRDKSLLVKTYTMERLSDIYKLGCMKHSTDTIVTNSFDWVLGKILRCLYDKDFRPDLIETILSGSLFRNEVSTKHIVNQWVRAFAGFDKVEVKALEKLLEQKQRLQQEMQKYLSLKQMSQSDDAPEIQKKILFYFRSMSRWFPDSLKAEEHFLILDQLKDANIWKALICILDPNTGSQQICTYREDLLRILGEKHRLCDFLGILSMKCSFLLFNKEHVKELLVEVSILKSAGNGLYITSCMNILVILARFSPWLLVGIEDDVVNLLKDDNEIIKEGALHILAEAGGTIREHLAMLSSPIELTLERLCLEGSRKQAKYAVHALAAITKDDGLKSLSVLYKKLVDMLEEKSNLPAVLQSLGCIAQTAMPVFETRESEIEEFIKSKILECENKLKDKDKVTACWDDRSELCSLKIFGIKTLAKSYMPVKDAYLRPGIERLFHVIRNILLFGEISKDIESSLIDKAHLKVASAKAILRLSRHWDHMIPVDIFHLTLKVTEINFPQAKKLFLSKVLQYVKDRALDAKYACAFLINIIGSKGAEYEEEKHNFGEIIQICHQSKTRQLSMQSETNSVMIYPEYMLPYLVHALAHHSCPDIDECKDVQAFENIYRLLHLFISMIVHGEEDGKSEANNSKERERCAALSSIFECIKESEDTVDIKKSKNSHAICDIGMSIIKRMQLGEDLPELPSLTTLPSTIYRLHEKKEEDGAEVKYGQTWLADESSIAHFESLSIDKNGTMESQNLGDDYLEDAERNGSEMPLSKIIKSLKTMGKKGKKGKKEKSEKVEAQTTQSDIDIMKMVREIHLDTVGESSKFEPSNGHAHVPSTKQEYQRTHPKRKTTSSIESNTVPVPKRRRSSSSHKAYKVSGPWSSPKGSTGPFTDHMHQTDTDSEALLDSENKMSIKKDVVSGVESDLLVSCLKKSASTLLKRKGRGSEQDSNKDGEVSDHGLKNTDKDDTVKSNNRKRRSIAGLTKCSSKEGVDNTKELIGCRIKVWWPTDRKFYEGVVKSYDSKQKKHKVTYDDGDVELLYLDKECWEVVESRNKSKKFDSGKSLNSLEDSSELKNSGGAHKSRNQINLSLSSRSRTKGKRRQKKKSKPKKRGLLECNFSKVKASENFDLSEDEPATTSQVEEMNTGDPDTQDVEEEHESSADKKKSDNMSESGSEQKQVDTKSQSHIEESDDEENVESENKVEKAVNDTKTSNDQDKPELNEEKIDVPIGSSNEDHKSESESGSETDEHHGSPTRPKDAEKETSKPSENNDAEYTDDETLSTWKRKAAVKSKRIG